MILSRAVVTNNYKYGNVTIVLFNDGIHDTKMNLTFDTKYAMEKFQLAASLRIRESDNDEEYKLEIFRTSVDVKRFFDGTSGSNFLIKALMENSLTTANFNTTFPWNTVKLTDIIILMDFSASFFYISRARTHLSTMLSPTTFFHQH